MKTFIKLLLCVIPLVGITACSSGSSKIFKTVPELDLERFSGQWYEVARFDHWFERDLVGCKANYSVHGDGTIEVENTGYKKNFQGHFKKSTGKARRRNAEEPGKLEVAFFLGFYSDYNVLELATDYRYALIAGKNLDYLWILSRTPRLTPEDQDYLLHRARTHGFDTNKIIWVPQK